MHNIPVQYCPPLQYCISTATLSSQVQCHKFQEEEEEVY